jgi:phage terminase large subunit-like protein
MKEIMTFPGCKYDDQIDSITQALDWIQNKRPRRGFFSEW